MVRGAQIFFEVLGGCGEILHGFEAGEGDQGDRGQVDPFDLTRSYQRNGQYQHHPHPQVGEQIHQRSTQTGETGVARLGISELIPQVTDALQLIGAAPESQ